MDHNFTQLMHFSCREETCAEHCSKNWKYESNREFFNIQWAIEALDRAYITSEEEFFKLRKELGMALNGLKDSETYIVPSVL